MTPDERINPLSDNAPPGDPAAPAPQGAEQQLRRLVSRRALVRAGWTVPVVLALHLPSNAVAQYACTHTDVPAAAHTDIAATAHTDTTVDGVHTDVPATLHTDIAATAHTDVCA